MTQHKVRVRFAPSPTGPLHIGGVRTALYNYLFAKKHNGDFILRIEDTDSQRTVSGAEEYITETFDRLHLKFDEGVHVGGKYAPYRQSERKEIYKKYVKELIDKNAAYYAFDTPEELDRKRKEFANFQYDASTRNGMRNSLTLSKEEVDELIAKEQYVVRFKIEPGKEVKVNDLIRGEVIVNSSVLDDKVLYKSADELPTYHLANVVDDLLMEISHVIRGEEWLPSAPLHVLLYQALDREDAMPKFAHLPLLLKPDGNGKLSKRDGDRLGFPVFPLNWKNSDGEIYAGYLDAGYFPETVINFLALLGWNPGNDREIFSLNELIDLFSLEHCSKSGAKFNYEKIKWFNRQYIQSKDNKGITDLFYPVLKEKGIDVSKEVTEKIVALVKDRVDFVGELWEQCSFFFSAPDAYDEKAVSKRWKSDSAEQLTELSEILSRIDDFSSENTESTVKQWINEKEYHLGNIMNAFRLALVGALKGPHLFDIIAVFGKEETCRRIKQAVISI